MEIVAENEDWRRDILILLLFRSEEPISLKM
jgi:hypothetical protein